MSRKIMRRIWKLGKPLTLLTIAFLLLFVSSSCSWTSSTPTLPSFFFCSNVEYVSEKILKSEKREKEKKKEGKIEKEKKKKK